MQKRIVNQKKTLTEAEQRQILARALQRWKAANKIANPSKKKSTNTSSSSVDDELISDDDRSVLRAPEAPKFATGQKAYWLANARLSYQDSSDTFELSFWVRNFLAKEDKTDTFDLSAEFNIIDEVWAEPRTFGTTMSLRF